MIKKLKTKLIFISLLSVSIVIGIILLSSYSAAMIKLTIQTDKIIKIISDNIDKTVPDENPFDDLETKYTTRYFTYRTYNHESTPNELDTKKHNIDPKLANKIYKKASHRIFNRGYINSYRYYRQNYDDEQLYIFVDCKTQIQGVNFLVSAAILISLLSLFTIFSLLRLFSFKILHPIIEAYKKQKKFITNASHELKTPLTIITANSELLEMEYGENEYTKTINRQVSKLTTMTNNLVTLSKIDELSTDDDMQDFSITEAAYDYVTEFEKVIGKEFNYKIDEDINYYGNEKLIRNLFSVLLDNARKYSISYVNFKVEKIKNKIHITCENDAENIEKGDLDYFTERFFRKDESRTKILDGTGIGLSLAKEITLIHKGHLKIYSPDGKIYIIHITI